MRDYLDQRKLHALCESMMAMDTKYGIPLLAPGYDPLAPGTKEDQDKIGRIALFQDGDKENAAIFVHACLMAARAFYVARRGDDAFNVLKKITPSLQDDADVYCSEPFATAEYLRGPGCEEFGRGRYTTVTGSAAWYFRVVLEGLFGVHSGYEGLEIVPNFPTHWLGQNKTVRMKKDFRGASYEIEYHLGSKINESYSITVNGKPIEGNRLTLSEGKGRLAIRGKDGEDIAAESGDQFKVVVK
jgi:cellobionic acid phosphorylase